ncbi:MAG: TAXI family TRAP transporter solute-binding subunit [Peptococcaceae bacterium]|jgi:TRAP transporter TAXI family solute receptor|nr:TAXI family TRAP transporter solute-binding subunit [Peptococcaceae bacterium]MDH7524651.1 TAXI family TRAP transporter solute-binding subunit [Peptococcaceae bacterium]
MHKNRILVCFIFAVMVLVLAAGCSKGSAEKEAPKAETQKTLSIATGGSGGTYFVIGSGIAKLVEQYLPGYKLVVQSTAASTENTRLVGTRKVDFAITMPDSAFFGMKGEREFQGNEKYEKLRAVVSGHTSVLQGLVLEKSPIKSMADLKGKKVALSAPSSPSMYVAMAALEAYGLKEGDYKPVFLSYAEMAEAVKNGSIDCGFVFAGVPTSSVMDLTTTTNIRILGMEENKADEILKKYPYFSKGKIPANTYKGQTNDLWVLTAPAILITHAEVSEEVVYNITKVILEHTKEMGEIHPAGLEWNLEDANQGVAIELHPGASKYLKEKGVIK